MITEQERAISIKDTLSRQTLPSGKVVAECLVYKPEHYCFPGQYVNGDAGMLVEDPVRNRVIARPDSILVHVSTEGPIVRQFGDQWLVEKGLMNSLALTAAALDIERRAVLFQILAQKPDKLLLTGLWHRDNLVTALDELRLGQFADLIGCAPAIALTRFMTSQNPG